MFEIPTFAELIDSVWEIIKTNQFAQGGMLISFLVALPRYILPFFQNLWQRIRRLIVYTVTVEQLDDLYIYLELWLQKNYEKKYRNVEAALKMDSTTEYANKDVLSGEYIDVFEEKVIYLG